MHVLVVRDKTAPASGWTALAQPRFNQEITQVGLGPALQSVMLLPHFSAERTAL